MGRVVRENWGSTESVQEWAQPSNLQEVKAFLGYYRNFFMDLATIACNAAYD